MMEQDKPWRGPAMEGWIARWYDRNVGRNPRRFESGGGGGVERMAGGGRVLEGAPGPGYLAIALARRDGYRVTGLDVSRSFVRIARENAARAGVAVDFREGDAAHMPFADGSFDYVVC